MADDVFATDNGGSKVSALDALVGEGKKFSSVEELAKGKAESDEHIKTIETENAELKAKLEAEPLAPEGKDKTTMADLLAAVKDAQTKDSSEGDRPMSQEELQEAVKSIYQDEKSADTKAANRARGNALVLGKVDGNVDAAKLLVAERAKTLGMTVEALAGLSENSPDAFAALIDKDSATAQAASPSVLPAHRTDALDAGGPVMEIEGFKTRAWFTAQRKEMGHVKYLNNPAIQAELTKSTGGLGERFNST